MLGPPQAAGQHRGGSSVPPCWESPEPGLVEPLPSPPGIWGGSHLPSAPSRSGRCPGSCKQCSSSPQPQAPASTGGTGSAPSTAVARGQAQHPVQLRHGVRLQGTAGEAGSGGALEIAAVLDDSVKKRT